MAYKQWIFTAAVSSALLLSSGLAVSQELVRLQCKGSVVQITDGREKGEVKSIDLVFDPGRSFVQINGYWGCLANLGELGSDKCRAFPVKVSDGEVEYFGNSEGDGYSGMTTLTINRYSGSFKATSVGNAKPISDASWRTMMINTSMECTAPSKLF